jgi:hypothetical protein
MQERRLGGSGAPGVTAAISMSTATSGSMECIVMIPTPATNSEPILADSNALQPLPSLDEPPLSGACNAQPVAALTWMGIFRVNWRLCLAVALVCAVTLSIFPGFLSGVYWVFCAARHPASA